MNYTDKESWVKINNYIALGLRQTVKNDCVGAREVKRKTAGGDNQLSDKIF